MPELLVEFMPSVLIMWAWFYDYYVFPGHLEGTLISLAFGHLETWRNFVGAQNLDLVLCVMRNVLWVAGATWKEGVLFSFFSHIFYNLFYLLILYFSITLFYF